MHEDDEARETPPAVITAVAAGTGALPFLAVYATIFIVHGGFHHVVPPDVTTSNGGELVVGLVCLAIFAVAVLAILWLLNGTRRWLFVLVQLVLLAIAIDFFIDPTKGGRVVSGLVMITSVIALLFAAHPQTWKHVGQRIPTSLGAVFGKRAPERASKSRPMPAGSGAASDTAPISARTIRHD